MAKYRFNSFKEVLFTITIVLPIGLTIAYFPISFLISFLETNPRLSIFLFFFGIILFVIIRTIIEINIDKEVKIYQKSPYYKKYLTPYYSFINMDKKKLTQIFINDYLKSEFNDKIHIVLSSIDYLSFITFHTSGIYLCKCIFLESRKKNTQYNQYLISPSGLNELKFKTIKVNIEQLKGFIISKPMTEQAINSSHSISILEFSTILKSNISYIYSSEQNIENYNMVLEYIKGLHENKNSNKSSLMINKAQKKNNQQTNEKDERNVDEMKQKFIDIITKDYNDKNK
jgi:hypothetical protein